MCSLFDQAIADLGDWMLGLEPISRDYGHHNPAGANFPRSPILILTQDKAWATARWGLIPPWAKEEPKVQPFNARCETVATNGLFRGALKDRRCIIPVARWAEYEGPKGKRTKVWFRDPDQPSMAIAGLWTEWRGEKTATMLTCPATEFVRPVHDRMIVRLDAEGVAEWMDPACRDGDSLVELLRPWEGDLVLER